jgi:integrase
MASLHKDPKGRSPYFYAAFYGPDGSRKFKSTKAKDRKTALKIALAFEDTAAKARAGELTVNQARKVLAEISDACGSESLKSYTAQSWMDEWLENKEASAEKTTMARYRQVVRDFLANLGAKAKRSILGVTTGDIVAFRDKLHSEGRTPSTCNTVIKKVLSVPFEAARKAGVIPTNPVVMVDSLKDRTKGSPKEPFTREEVLSLLKHSQGDWHGAILLAATTGHRLGDVTNLTHDLLDRKNGTASITSQKTGALVTSILRPEFTEWMDQQPAGIGRASIFPSLHGKRVNGAHGLSMQFRGIMEVAQISERVTAPKGAKGRTRNSKGFHSFRHTFTSELANADVAPEIRQKLTGHKDAKVHAGYTHTSIKTLKRATNRLPRLKLE